MKALIIISLRLTRSSLRRHSIGALLCLLFAPALQADSTPLRLLPKGARANEFAGLGAQTLAVGMGKVALGSPDAFNAGGVQCGAVYLWDQKTGKPLPTIYPPALFANAGTEFGVSIAISGKLLAVGADGGDAGPGGVENYGITFVYDLTTGALLNKIVPVNPLGSLNERWGKSIAMDGDYLVMGSSEYDAGAGAQSGGIMVFRFSNNSLVKYVPVGAANAVAAGDHFGYCVSVRNGVIAAGAPFATVAGDALAGRIYLMDASNGAHLAQIDNPDRTRPVPLSGVGDFFGEAMTLTVTRNLIVGCSTDGPALLPGAGSTNTYSVKDLIFPSLSLTSYGYAANNGLGKSVASANGVTIVGSPGVAAGGANRGDAGVGSVPSAIVNGDALGTAVAVGDGIVVASAPGDNSVDLDAGAVWMFKPGMRFSLDSDLLAVLKSGESAPDVPNASFAGFSELSLAQTGFGVYPAFTAKLSGTSGTGNLGQGLWINDPSLTFIDLVKQSGRAPDMVAPASIIKPTENVKNYLYFRAKDLPSKRNAFYYHDGVSPTELFFDGSNIAGVGIVKNFSDGRADNKEVGGFGYYALPGNLKLSAVAPIVTAANDSFIYLTLGNTTIREGAAVPGIVGFNFGQMPSRFAYAGGRVVMSHYVTGVGVTPDNNILVNNNGTQGARRGDLDADLLGKFSTFLGETLSSSDGKVLLRATLALVPGSVTTANNEGLWSNRDGAATWRMIARKGNFAPGVGSGVKFKKFIRYAINTFGDVMYLAQVSGPGITAANDMVLYYNRNGATEEILMREGSIAPGCGRARIGNISAIDFTTRTDAGAQAAYYGVQATLVVEAGGATSANNLAWFVGNSNPGSVNQRAVRLPTLSLRKGATSLGPVGRQSVVSFTMPAVLSDTSGAGNTGMAHVLSANQGTATAIVTYPDKSTALTLLFSPVD